MRGVLVRALDAMQSELPIDPLLPVLVDALRAGTRAVLRAAPGAGKTTRVPAALLDAGSAGDRGVVVLEPRRIAARAAADFVARARGGAVGDEVGYRVRFEQRGGPATRLWFVTEGVFSRQLAADPFLEAAGVVVLDEFHERHLQGDVALAVVRELQETVRPDLKLVVMSATLDTDRLATFLDGAAVLTSEGRAFPVAIEHVDAPDTRRLAERVASAVARVLAEGEGDVLVFLPGLGEIRRAAEALAPVAAARHADVLPLHGELPLDAQERALRPGPRRRIVLATNVAETALTVEGVTAVVDTGLARVARLDARHGLNALRLAPISRASAEQRAGRAGRTGPGRCLRLWSRAEHAGRRAHETAEILRLDLSRTVLELRAWGLGAGARLRWLDAPPDAALARAEHLLCRLGAIDDGGALTGVGRRLLALPTEPRIGRMLIEAERLGAGADGALWAALAGERDVIRAGLGPPRDRPAGDSDLALRAELFAEAAHRRFAADACRALGVDPGAVRAVERARAQLARHVRGTDRDAPADALGRCVLTGFPDRVARRREPGSSRAVMVGGTGLVLAPESVVRGAELFVALDVEATGGPEARVRVASAVDRAWLPTRTETELVWDAARERVVARTRERWEDLTLGESIRTDVDRAAAGTILAQVAAADPAAAAALDDGTRQLVARLAFLARAMPALGLPDDPTALLAGAVTEVAAGCVSFAELRRTDLGAAIRRHLDHAQRTALERDAPARLRLPSGRETPIVYDADRPPAVAARIQELFGLAATPRLAGGRVPLVVQLLAPSGRPVQITDDLASFWRTTYAEVKKQLRGRYPKHAWPDDPLTAVPSRRPPRRQ